MAEVNPCSNPRANSVAKIFTPCRTSGNNTYTAPRVASTKPALTIAGLMKPPPTAAGRGQPPHCTRETAAVTNGRARGTARRRGNRTQDAGSHDGLPKDLPRELCRSTFADMGVRQSVARSWTFPCHEYGRGSCPSHGRVSRLAIPYSDGTGSGLAWPTRAADPV